MAISQPKITIEGRLDSVEYRLTNVESHLVKIDKRLDNLESDMQIVKNGIDQLIKFATEKSKPE